MSPEIEFIRLITPLSGFRCDLRYLHTTQDESGPVKHTSSLELLAPLPSCEDMAGVHPKGAGLGCVLFGDGPVPTFPEGRYFEVCNLALSRTYATRPWEMKRSLGL